MKKLVMLVMMALLVPAAAYAKNACKDDKVKFCKDVKASGGKINDCLRQHMNEVAPACKDQLSKPKEGKPKNTEKKTKGKEPGDTTPSENKKPDAPKAEGGAPAPAGDAMKPAETTPPAAPGGAESKP